jgi:hypothetical protein
MARRAILVRPAYDQAMPRSAVDWQQVLHRCPASATAPEAEPWALLDRTLRQTLASPRWPPPCGIIKRVEIFPDGTAGLHEMVPIDSFRTFGRALLVRICLDQAGIDSEPFASDKTFVDAALCRGLE